MEGELVNYGIGGLLAYSAIKELGLLARSAFEKKKNGNGNGCAPEPAWGIHIKWLRDWFNTKGNDIHQRLTDGTVTLDALLRTTETHFQLQREHNTATREERRRHQDKMEALYAKLTQQ